MLLFFKSLNLFQQNSMIKKVLFDGFSQKCVIGITYLFLILAALLSNRDSRIFVAMQVAISLLGVILIGRLFYLIFDPKRGETNGAISASDNSPAGSSLRMAAYFLLLIAILGPETDGVWVLYVLGISLFVTIFTLVAGRWKKN